MISCLTSRAGSLVLWGLDGPKFSRGMKVSGILLLCPIQVLAHLGRGEAASRLAGSTSFPTPPFTLLAGVRPVLASMPSIYCVSLVDVDASVRPPSGVG
jgi:hypothetical protein